MPCLFQSTTQKGELPRFVLEDSTLHNSIYIFPSLSSWSTFCFYWVFLAVFQAAQKSFWINFEHKWHNSICPNALWLSLLRLTTFQQSEDN